MKTTSNLAAIEIRKIAGALGAVIDGADLTKLDDKLFVVLKEALLEYQVIFFRDQPISSEDHRSLASMFGKMQPHPAYPTVEGFPEISILENSEKNPSKIELWHADMTFMECPPMGSVLHAYEVPEYGGDTLFASMSAAYESLSSQMQRFLSGLTAVHDFSFGFKESLEEPGGRERLKEAIYSNPPVEHPVIRVHPETRSKGLFVNVLFTKCIKGMKPTESDALLHFLYSHLKTPEFTCRFNWEKGSIAFWDNRITQHKPVNDYFPAYRQMRRITIEGDRPV